MNRMSHPFLQDYYDRVAECLLQRAFSLGQFQVNPPEEIFMKLEELPRPLKDLENGQKWEVRKLLLSNNHNVRIFYLILLKLCFTGEDCYGYLKRVLKVIFDQRFDIKFPLNKNSDPKLFNSNQFKKLFIDILYHLDMQEYPNIEETVGKYPLIDIVIIYIMRSILTMKGQNYDYGTAIPNSVVFKELCDFFEISVVQKDRRYIINKNFVVSEEFPSFLIVASKQIKQGLTDTRQSSASKINDIEDDDYIKQQVGKQRYHGLPTVSALGNMSFAVNNKEFTPKENNNYYPNIFESQVITMDHLTESKFKSQISAQSRQSISTPINKVVTPKKKMNLAEQIRKSTVRVSMLRSNNEAKSKDKVSTENIFCRQSYFGGGNRDNLVKSSINPSSYQLSSLGVNYNPYSSGISPSKFTSTTPQFNKPSYFSQFSQPQNSDPLSTLGPKPKQSTQNSYYKDFTNSFLLQQLPQITKSSIKSIKKNFIKERSNIRNF